QQTRDDREAINRDHPTHYGRRAVPVPQRERGKRGRDQAGERQREVPQPLRLRRDRLVEQAEDRDAAQEELGEDRRELELRRRDHGSVPFACTTAVTPTSVVWSGATCATTACAVGSMRSVRSFGKTPKTSNSARTGARTSTSRRFTSGRIECSS